MESARQRVIGRGEIDRVEGRRRSERDEIGRVGVVRKDDRLARLKVLAEGAKLRRGEERAGTRADRADAIKLPLADDPLQLLPQVKGAGTVGNDLRPLGAERTGRLSAGRT